ncbi:unnamed protein product, partial [Heterosigma akashiwo]
MRVLYGGQVDAHDYHRAGFDEDLLTAYLAQAGFCEIQRVKSFGLFRDSSELLFKGEEISLNILAKA